MCNSSSLLLPESVSYRIEDLAPALPLVVLAPLVPLALALAAPFVRPRGAGIDDSLAPPLPAVPLPAAAPLAVPLPRPAGAAERGFTAEGGFSTKDVSVVLEKTCVSFGIWKLWQRILQERLIRVKPSFGIYRA